MKYTYTTNLENEIWNMAEELDETDDCESVIDFLNSKSSFQSFGARLAAFIANKLSLPLMDSKTVISALSKQCEENGVPISEISSPNTLRNWFEKDNRPKKSLASRHSMFALAFALELSIDEIKDLFHKIYLDRAVNYRDEKEIIYYFCLKNDKAWTDAERLIADVRVLPKDYSDNTQYTQLISNSIDSFQAEKDLIEYIRQNGHNFEQASVTASKVFNRYLLKAKKFAKDEIIQYDLDHQNKWINNLSNNILQK